MRLPAPVFWWMAAGALAASPPELPPGRTAAAPPVPQAGVSPAQLFRQLLNEPTDLREAWLSGKSAPAREFIRAKLAEFSALAPDERELRLRTAELEFYLGPLLSAESTNRPALVSKAPADLQPLLKDRVDAWEKLGAEARREVLESEHTLSLWVRIESADPQSLTNQLARAPKAEQAALRAQFVRWSALSQEDRARKTAGFQRFFDLTAAEREPILRRLAETERAQMEITLRRFAAFQPGQRDQCIAAFHRLAEMSASDREEFLRDAARWQALKPEEREAWRRMVAEFAPRPPLPPLPRANPHAQRGPTSADVASTNSAPP